MTDLEQLLRNRQDQLRGRRLDWRDHVRDYVRSVDWSFVGFTACLMLWGGCQILIAVAQVMQR
jgi:hypothetical protein